MPPKLSDSIVGIPIKRIRPIFRGPYLNGKGFSVYFSSKNFQEKFGLSNAKAGIMVKQLQQLGYLSIEHLEFDGYKHYKVTEEGKHFGIEKYNNPISIEKADTLYAGFLKRIKIVNEDPDFLLKVSGYCIWGDYLNGNKSIKSIDIIIALGYKDTKSYDEKMQEKWNSYSGYLGVMQRYSLPLTEVRKYLKAKSPYLSIYLLKESNTSGSAKTVSYFDADGNYLYSYRKQKQSQQSSGNNPSKQNESADLVGRLLFNERKGRVSKKQILRKFTEKEVELLNIHDQVLEGMVKLLRKEYPECIISPECFIVGLAGRIDIVRQTKDGINILYEIKTYAKTISSIRAALGQLLEYSFYPDRKLSEELYIVSHIPASLADLKYLKHIERMLGIKIGYLHYNCETKQIENSI